MKWGFEVEDQFSESAVGKEHIRILRNCLEIQGTHWFKNELYAHLVLQDLYGAV